MEHLQPDADKDLATIDLHELFNENNTQMQEISDASIPDDVLIEILQNANVADERNYIQSKDP